MGKTGRRSVSAGLVGEDDDDRSGTSRAVRESRIRKSGSSSTKSSKGSSSKKKKPSSFNKVVIGTTKLVPSVGSDLLALASDLKAQPLKTGRRIAVRLCVYVWVFAVLFTALNLLGMSPFGSGDDISGDVSDGQRSIFARIVPSIGGGDGANHAQTQSPRLRAEDDDDEDSVESKKEEGGAESGNEEDIPAMQGYEAKKSNKVNKAKEKELACKEVDCNEACNRKINPKCAAKKTCRADRVKICARRCLKARCEDRCKDEPKYGYVEREQKMDKCKEGCQNLSTQQHNKCIKKCHSEFKPCKSRCHEISMKFQCDSKKLDLASILHQDEEKPAKESKKEKEKLAKIAAEVKKPDADFDDEVI